MALVDLIINGKAYRLACDAGQEERVQQLAARFEQRVQELAGKRGKETNDTLFLLVAMMMEDALEEAKNSQDAFALKRGQERLDEMENSVAETIGDIATRIEKIAENLEKA